MWLVLGGGVPGPRGCGVPGLRGGWCGWSRGWCAWSRGGSGIPACTEAETPPCISPWEGVHAKGGVPAIRYGVVGGGGL